MAVIRPFQALRPTREAVARVAALPYDVYNSAEARVVVAQEPMSFLGIDRAETAFPEGQDLYAPEVYEKANELLQHAEADGTMVQDASPCYYLYELTMDGRTQTGLVAASSVDDYLNNVIRKHENTLAAKEQDRIRHVDTCSAQTGPIFLAYRAQDDIRAMVQTVKEQPSDQDFTSDDGVRHRVWVISDARQIEALTRAFAEVPCTYIADGHHRAASAVKVSLMRREAHPDYTGEEEFNYFLSVLFPDEELKILDYNRVLADLAGMTPEELLARLAEAVEVEPAPEAPYHPVKKGEMGFLLGSTWYKLTARPERTMQDPVGGLDVSFLQREILTPIWGIDDPRTDSRIDFVGGIRGLEELERRCGKHTCAPEAAADQASDAAAEPVVQSGTAGPDAGSDTGWAAAFAMYPTSIEELLEVADAELLMPPKSTWFEPKLRSGIFIHKIEK